MVIVDLQRAIGALLGSAIGDALGAPFEFGPAGQYTRAFPSSQLGPSSEMIGGGGLGWKPGEFTDDTQMAIVLAESLLGAGGFDGADTFERFRVWARTANDVGIQTSQVLADGDWQHSADRLFEHTGLAAGNGSLMRATTSALYAAHKSLEDSFELARAQSGLTHGDPAAGWGVALYHGMIRAGLHGRVPLEELPHLFDLLPQPHAERYLTMLTSDVALDDEPNNGTVWTCLAQAVRIVRHTTTFEDAMRQACDLAGDVDTVACVTGGLAGATFGIQATPSRWLTMVHGKVGDTTYTSRDLQHIALALIGRSEPALAVDFPARGPTEITPGVYAASTLGALTTSDDTAVLSLCRVEDRFAGRPYRREFFLTDQVDANPGLRYVLDDALAEIDAFRDAGIPVVVHCHAGESRTSFIMRAWLMRHEHLSTDGATERLADAWPFVTHHNTDFDAALAQRV